MYRHLITHKLQRLYENFHKEAPADLLAHLGSLDAYSNQFRTYMLKHVHFVPRPPRVLLRRLRGCRKGAQEQVHFVRRRARCQT